MGGSRLNVQVDRSALRRVREAAADGLADATEFLLDEANRTIPHEEGILEGSGDVDVDRDALVGQVTYDGPHAVRQHEDLSLRHDPGRRAKWLEHAFKERGAEALAHVGARMRGDLG